MFIKLNNFQFMKFMTTFWLSLLSLTEGISIFLTTDGFLCAGSGIRVPGPKMKNNTGPDKHSGSTTMLVNNSVEFSRFCLERIGAFRRVTRFFISLHCVSNHLTKESAI